MGQCKTRGCTSWAKQGHWYCYQCYRAWQVEMGRIAAPTEQHTANVCVGAEQLAEKDAQISVLHAEVAALERTVRAIRGTPCQCPSNNVHPSAQTGEYVPRSRQLDRIESLAKQGASRSVFWPCLATFLVTISLIYGPQLV
jgi:hypothetical protein